MPRKPVAPVRRTRVTRGRFLERALGGAVHALERRAHGVEAAVDVEDLGRHGAREVRQEEADRAGDGPGVVGRPAERRLLLPRVGELGEPGDAAGGDRAERPGADEVHAHAARAEVAREVARGRLERGLGHAHPVVDRPGDRGVEVHPDDARALLGVEVGEGDGERLERERARLERGDRALGRRGQELAAERVLGREGDRVQHAVDAAPAVGQVGGDRLEVLGLVHVELEHVGRVGQLLGGAVGQALRAAEAGQHHLRARLLRLAGDLPRDRVARDDARDQELLVFENELTVGCSLPRASACGTASSERSASIRRRRVSAGATISST